MCVNGSRKVGSRKVGSWNSGKEVVFLSVFNLSSLIHADIDALDVQ